MSGKGDKRRPEGEQGAFEKRTPFREATVHPCPKCKSRSLRTVIKADGRHVYCARCATEIT